MVAFFSVLIGSAKIQRNSKTIRVNFVSNHRIRNMPYCSAVVTSSDNDALNSSSINRLPDQCCSLNSMWWHYRDLVTLLKEKSYRSQPWELTFSHITACTLHLDGVPCKGTLVYLPPLSKIQRRYEIPPLIHRNFGFSLHLNIYHRSQSALQNQPMFR